MQNWWELESNLLNSICTWLNKIWILFIRSHWFRISMVCSSQWISDLVKYFIKKKQLSSEQSCWICHWNLCHCLFRGSFSSMSCIPLQFERCPLGLLDDTLKSFFVSFTCDTCTKCNNATAPEGCSILTAHDQQMYKKAGLCFACGKSRFLA